MSGIHAATFFRLAFKELDGWIRRKLRCVLWMQWKRPKTKAAKLIKRG
ncbi:MAG: group II intron maturase-specific domain-containing protein [Thermodesulfovibrionales bacterium]